MFLENKLAVVWGGSGSVGGAVAEAYAREGANVVVVGRTKRRLDAVVRQIAASGGRAEARVVDVTDHSATMAAADEVVEQHGRIDISFDALSNDDVQGRPLIDLQPADVVGTVAKGITSRFNTTQAVARHMLAKRSGVILTITGGYLQSFPSIGGTIATWAAIEALFRQWGSELAPQGIRTLWIRTTGIPETIPDTGDALTDLGTGYGVSMTRDQIVADMASQTLLGKLPTLTDVGNAAVFLASDRAAAMTSTFVNISCGAILD